MRYFALLLGFSVNALAGVENLVRLLWPSVLQAKPRPKIKFNNHVTVTKHHETYLYNYDPLKPHLYSKTGVYRGIHYFPYFCSKT